ncbi:MAG TPA: hypothetical protein VN763_04555 [Saprospiraceae bacterium]|nr:hypothetical protein [Saprospiraceae bacterium]HZV44480.1 hypothetical protein [Saprospiraceae bacterium]
MSSEYEVIEWSGNKMGQKKSAPVGADLLDTNKDIDSKKYLFP